MRRTLWFLGVTGLLAVAGLSACNKQTAAPPRQGETVLPRLSGDVHWTAGRPGQLGVRLVARGQDSSGPRTLSFDGLPEDANPVATVTFFEGERALAPVTVTLDHRC
jgi:hypothetical protein